LLDKKVIHNWYKLKERKLMVIALIVWMGFKQSYVEYNQLDRFKGTSSFSFGKLFNLAINTVVSFSFFPIRLISLLGIIFSIIGFFYALFLIYGKFFRDSAIEGWTSLMVIIFFYIFIS
jgi:dolichol-phosphate mannosyltransferase|tara:strand:- start:533 stop:889 length:357 start_codon:yes stop_codon:yes gene_type:complete